MEIEFRRNESSRTHLSREDIEAKYINDPLMQRYLEDKTKLALYQIVDLIDDGKSKEAAKKLMEKEQL